MQLGCYWNCLQDKEELQGSGLGPGIQPLQGSLCLSAESTHTWLLSERLQSSLWQEIRPLVALDSHLPSGATPVKSNRCLLSFINHPQGRTMIGPTGVIYPPPRLITIAKKNGTVLLVQPGSHVIPEARQRRWNPMIDRPVRDIDMSLQVAPR